MGVALAFSLLLLTGDLRAGRLVSSHYGKSAWFYRRS